MTDPLEDRLRSTLRAHAEQAEVSGDAWPAIMERAERAAVRARLQRLAAAAAVALVAVAVPIALNAARGGDPEVRLTEPAPDPSPTGAATPTPTPDPTGAATPTPTPGPTATPSPSPPAVAPGAWSRLDDQGVFAPGEPVHVADVTAKGSTVVAVGSYTVPEGSELPRSRAGIWRSDGGTEWSFVAAGDTLFGDPGTDTGASAVTATEDGFVAVGQLHRNDRTRQPLAWTSPDGRSWQRLELPGEGTVQEVTMVKGGVVAVGETAEENPVMQPARRPAIWTSPDGREWQHLTLPSLGIETTLREVAVAGDRVVALSSSAVALSDDDGESWVQMTLVEAGFEPDIWIEGLDVLPDGRLLAGSFQEGQPLTSYVSRDGASWERVGAFPPGQPDAVLRVHDLLARPDGSVAAVGSEMLAGANSVAWTSGDGGVTWELAPAEGDAFANSSLTAVTEVDGFLVAVGQDERANSPGELTVSGVGGVWVTAAP